MTEAFLSIGLQRTSNATVHPSNIYTLPFLIILSGNQFTWGKLIIFYNPIQDDIERIPVFIYPFQYDFIALIIYGIIDHKTLPYFFLRQFICFSKFADTARRPGFGMYIIHLINKLTFYRIGQPFF